ncbi:MAG TPA: efflux RND transporter periplasmic adaptor subunit [Gemmatales bacterium]|nr:efflux RND transporter periplasmic adaptor subunit [Gemmatales bacterium]
MKFTLLFVLVFLIGCNNSNLPAVPAVPPSKVNLKRNVELGKAEKRALQYAIETPGVLEAERVTEIAAGVSGIVDEVMFREGELVTTDTVLITIDQRRFETQLALAYANEQRARAALEQARDAARRAQEARGAITEEERTRTALIQKTSEAEVAAAEANRRLAEIQLDRSRVRPPYPGRINLRKVTAGMFIAEKGIVATIADVSRLRLVGFVPESAAAAVRNRMTFNIALSAADAISQFFSSHAQPLSSGIYDVLMLQLGLQAPQLYDVEFTLLASPRNIYRGRLFYMSTVANPDTHMFESKAEIFVSGSETLQSGYTARIRFPLRTNDDACIIPEEAVRPNERGFVTFIPVQRTSRTGQTEWVAQARIVELGYREPGWVEVKNGLQPGDIIIKRGAEALEDGTPIQFAENQVTLN